MKPLGNSQLASTITALASTAQSSSQAQREAEVAILQVLAVDHGPLTSRRITVGRAYVQVDGSTADESVLIEAYARIGPLRGGQPKKIAQDILKLALVKREPGRENTRTIIALASQEARASIAGWLQQAAETFDVELQVVALPTDVHAAVLAAQARQRMTNAEVD